MRGGRTGMALAWQHYYLALPADDTEGERKGEERRGGDSSI